MTSVTFSPSFFNSWTHFYLVWDFAGGLVGGKTARAFINNSNECSTNQSFNLSGYPVSFDHSVLQISGTVAQIMDNVKIWDHVVSEDPSWEYNNGTGREDALHPVYGEANGYKPMPLNSANSGGVGYYGAP